MKISLRAARVDAGMTQQEVARQIEVSTPTYRMMEREPQRIRIERAHELAALFGREMSDIEWRRDGG